MPEPDGPRPLAVAAAVLFLSVPTRLSAHAKVTWQAAREAGCSRRAAGVLRRAVQAVDLEDMTIGRARGGFRRGPLRLAATSSYDAARHCDRGAGADDAEALAAAREYALGRRAQAVAAARAGDAAAAWSALGEALHALQDMCSHTDAVERGVAADDLDGDGFLPSGLRVTGFDPACGAPGKPPGDDYPHDGNAKDRPLGRAAGGHAGFAAARSLALAATARFLRRFREEAGEGAWAALQRPPRTSLRPLRRSRRARARMLWR